MVQRSMVTISVTRNKSVDASGWLTLVWDIPLVGEKYYPASHNAPAEGGWRVDDDAPPKLVNVWVNQAGSLKPLGLVDEDSPEKLEKLGKLYPLWDSEISRAMYWHEPMHP